MQNDPTTFGPSPDPELDQVLAQALDVARSRADGREGTWDVEAQLRRAIERLMEAGGSGATLARPEGTRQAPAGTVHRGWRIPLPGARRIGLWVAAAATLAVAITFVAPSGRRGRAEPPGRVRVYATTTGQQALVMLDDGTRVTLAPRSTLRLLAFDTRSRTVALDGEAHFDVPRAAGAPFVVRVGGADARVLGTAFVARHYAGERVARVAVASGKVSVSAHASRRPGVTLAAGDVGGVIDSVVSARSVGDVTPYTGWVDGRLVFRSAPTTEVLDALARWYGYEFHLADPALANKNLTAVLSTKSSAAALSTLKLILNVDLTFDGNVVILTPRHSRSTPGGTRRDAGEALSTHTHEVGR